MPVEHVCADGVAPAHIAPNRGTRVVLAEEVIVAVEEDGAVGIIHLVAGGKKMETRTQRIGGD